LGNIRIIGGKWRGRLLPVLEQGGLRPTPDRIRETLFNWLREAVPGASCLDLFAGTGALGFEALSRGADFVLFVESQKKAAAMLTGMVQKLEAKCEVVCKDAITWLKENEKKIAPFDLIFLDPPFDSGLLNESIALLAASAMIKPGTLVYIESPVLVKEDALPDGWQLLKQKKAGEVAYQLIRIH